MFLAIDRRYHFMIGCMLSSNMIRVFSFVSRLGKAKIMIFFALIDLLLAVNTKVVVSLFLTVIGRCPCYCRHRSQFQRHKDKIASREHVPGVSLGRQH